MRFALLLIIRRVSTEFRDLGAIAPGYLADMQLLDALDGSNPYAVFVGGKLVVEDGKLLDAAPAQTKMDFPNTVHMPQVQSADDFRLKAPQGCTDTARVLVLSSNQTIFYTAEYETLPVRDAMLTSAAIRRFALSASATAMVRAIRRLPYIVASALKRVQLPRRFLMTAITLPSCIATHRTPLSLRRS